MCFLTGHWHRQGFNNCKLRQIYSCKDNKLSHNVLNASDSDGGSWLENKDPVPPTESLGRTPASTGFCPGSPSYIIQGFASTIFLLSVCTQFQIEARCILNSLVKASHPCLTPCSHVESRSPFFRTTVSPLCFVLRSCGFLALLRALEKCSSTTLLISPWKYVNTTL